MGRHRNCRPALEGNCAKIPRLLHPPLHSPLKWTQILNKYSSHGSLCWTAEVPVATEQSWVSPFPWERWSRYCNCGRVLELPEVSPALITPWSRCPDGDCVE